VTLISGFLVSLGKMSFWIAYPLIMIADLTSDTLYYLLGRGGKRPVQRWGRYLGLTTARVEKLERYFHRNAGKTLVLGKLAHGFGGPILVAAGLAHMPYKKFLFYNSAATIPKSLLLMVLGFYAGAAYLKFSQYFNEVALFFLILGLASPVLYFIIPWVFRKLVRIPRYLNPDYENTDR